MPAGAFAALRKAVPALAPTGEHAPKRKTSGPDVRCLRRLIPALQEAGYTLCTVSDLLGLETPETWLVTED